MSSIEVKATFKNINIKDKTVLQFELSPFYLKELPDTTKLANTDVMLTIESEQPELPQEEVELEPDYEQPQIPIDDPEPVEDEVEYEVMGLPEPGLPEPDSEPEEQPRLTKKEQLVEEAEALGIEVPSRATIAEIEALIAEATDEEGEE